TGGIPGCNGALGTAAAPKLNAMAVLGSDKLIKPAVKPIGTQGLPKDMTAVAKHYVNVSKGNINQAFQRRNLLWEKEAGLMVPNDLSVLMNAEGKPGQNIKEVYEDALLNKQSKERKLAKKREIKLAALGVHGAELVDEATKHYVEKFARKNKALCANPTAFKKALRAEVGLLTYYTTLLHEMGHNFGLRHNFHGSADSEDNFHPQYKVIKSQIGQPNSEVTELDLDFYAYTSVMDYSAAFYEVQGGLGPYDENAIRFGYNRNLSSTDPSVKANFKFCTDHGVGEDTLCTRHDKGMNTTFATLNNIERFNRGYLKSHFRRDRADFEQQVWGVILRNFFYTFIPTRQVMDELIYQIITAQPAQQNSFGCTSEFYRASIAAGEIANICDPAVAEDNGVNVLDWSTLPNGLFTKNAQGQLVFRKDPKTYIPNGLADLVLANALARQFFASVIGSPEVGVYLLEVMDMQNNTLKLTQLPYGATDEERLYNLAIERNITNIDAFIAANKGNVVNLNAGPINPANSGNGYFYSPVASLFTSGVTIEGGFEKLENIGFIWNKYLAMIALGSRYIGVEKYMRLSMAGNAYLWPQGRKWTTNLIDGMATDRQYIAEALVTTKGGKQYKAFVPASSDINTRLIAIQIGLMDLATDQDSSFLDKLRMCNSQDASKCTPTSGQAVVQFETASGSDFFRAVQTLEKDSIAFQIVADGKVISDERKANQQIVANSPAMLAEAKNKMTAGEAKRKTLHDLFMSEATLKQYADTVTANTGAVSTWVKSLDVINRLDQYGVFKTLAHRNWAVNVIVDAYNKVGTANISAAKKQQIQAAILDYVQVLVQISETGAPGSLDNVVMIKVAPELVKINTQDLGAKETVITVTRRMMKWLALD
ncbi:MAG TPA: hypothetical protein VFV50_04475, partial [Bdellovibrionales bacterium]|nr:hypothetical protein [Bdellovibrionales bacterium]